MTKDSFKTVINALNELNTQLIEGITLNDEQEMYQDEVQPQDSMEQGDSQEEAEMFENDVIHHEPIIGKIRETAIEGLKKYADHPTSSIYNFFKKVFLESDKVLTDNGSQK